MPVPHVLFAPETAQCLQRGIDVMADLLGATLGPLPSTIVDQAHAGYEPEALEDAPTVARRIVALADRHADVAAMLLRNLVWQAEHRLGDGGATVAVLTQAMFREARVRAEAGVPRTRLAQGLHMAAEQVCRAIRQQSRPVCDETDLSRVALTATGDREVAALIGEVAYVMDPDAIIQVEAYAGRRMESRYLTPAILEASLANHMQLEAQNITRVQMSDSLVAAVDGTLDESDDMLALLEAALYAQRSRLVVLARGFSETVLAWMALNHRNPESPIAVAGAVYEPMSAAGDVPYEDIAHLTGATVLGLPHTKPVAGVRPDDLGYVPRIEVGRQQTSLVPARARWPAIREHARLLRHRKAHLDRDDPAQGWMRRRIGTMDMGFGQIEVGADTDVERNWRQRIVERGLRSVRHALRGGVVPGGGCSLLQAAHALEEPLHVHEEIRQGFACAARALSAPALRILANAHHPAPAAVVERIGQAPGNMAYDVLQGCEVDAYATGLLDPAHVTSEAFRIAASGAAMALTIDTIVFRRNPPHMARP